LRIVNECNFIADNFINCQYHSLPEITVLYEANLWLKNSIGENKIGTNFHVFPVMHS